MTGTPLGRRGTKGKAGAPTDEITVTLAGNPNVGKSTLFNALTGLDQHTGNWPGKTVASADGRLRYRGKTYRLVDTPGTYSLAARSPEEEVTRDFLCYGDANVTVVVCDATCLARNLHLVLQILAFSPRAVVCINLMDEAARRGIAPDLDALSHRLGVPVVGTVARRKKTLAALMEAVEKVAAGDAPALPALPYPAWLTAEQATLATLLARVLDSIRAQALVPYLLSGDAPMPPALAGDDTVLRALAEAKARLAAAGHDEEDCHEAIALALAEKSGELYAATVTQKNEARADRDRRLDRFFTGRRTAYPVMLLLLLAILFLTIVGANYPSAWLSAGLSRLLDGMAALLISLHAPPWLYGALIDGVFCVLFRVVAVMLPPMAIFFPLFTLLEDSGYLPRIAYNLDRPFCACRACGKQALTMCMGFGCNAAGVVGCRIIDSPRERLLAILTNSLVPCNGRFPALLSLIAMFFIGATGGFTASLLSAVILTLFLLLGIGATFLATYLLSHTLLRGEPSSFTLEMSPYRRPQVGQVLVRSLLDRTLSVLWRAVAVAAPAGLLIWLLANLSFGGASVLAHLAAFLDPLGSLLGMDGVILLAFILGLPANEIVLPLAVMLYTAAGSPVEPESVGEMHALLVANGWTVTTALCTAVFFLFHWPCSTTLLSVKRETGKWRYAAVAAVLPTLLGALLCVLIAAAGRLFL
ncbi:MAG: ferrous iron transport protein B [Clostridia bacterium]|nr:ferrous iron transport protein B [Clostridia bacterium]